MVDISRMPLIAMFSVRGIGVAESVSTSTPRLISLMCSLCVTPKRCSSSTTSRPRSLNFTSLRRSLCVPMTRSHFPEARSDSSRVVCAAVWKRLSTPMFTGKPKNLCSAV